MCRREDIIKRILSNVTPDPATGCWNWNGNDSGTGRGGGYPRMSLNSQTVAVHRVLYTCMNGYIPSRQQVDHKCKNRSCLNPDHLEMTTKKTNQKRKFNPPDVNPNQLDLEEYIHGKIN